MILSLIPTYFIVFLPSLSKVFFNFFSTMKMLIINMITCTVWNITLSNAILFSLLSLKGICKIMLSKSINPPVLIHSLPQHFCAKSHVSWFFIEKLVLYPIMLFISFGECLYIRYPSISIIAGNSKLHKNIKINIFSITALK